MEHFEADIVSTRIGSILQAGSFAFVPSTLMRIIVIFSMECSRMIGLDGGDGSIRSKRSRSFEEIQSPTLLSS